jgi:hypothetical protein
MDTPFGASTPSAASCSSCSSIAPPLALQFVSRQGSGDRRHCHCVLLDVKLCHAISVMGRRSDAGFVGAAAVLFIVAVAITLMNITKLARMGSRYH